MITPTAQELWNDKKFIEKRYWEQSRYMNIAAYRYDIGEINENRKSKNFK